MSLDPRITGAVSGQIAVGNALSRTKWSGEVVEPLAYIERRIAPQMIGVSGTMDHEQTLGDGDLPDLPTLGFYGPSECICASFMRARGGFTHAHYHYRHNADVLVSPADDVAPLDTSYTQTATAHIDAAAGTPKDYPEFAQNSRRRDLAGELGLGLNQQIGATNISIGDERGLVALDADVEAIRYSAEVRQVAPYLVILR